MQSVNREMKSDPFQIFQMKEEGERMKKWIAGLTGAVLISLCGTGLLLPAAAAPEAAESGEIGVNREMRRQDWMEKQKAAGKNGRR